MQAEQQRLGFDAGPSNVEGAEPRVWVSRMVLWQDLGDAPIRDVPLRRGLNIVWSPEAGGGGDDLAMGHAAGKSLFCRMLRYCLGEETFATADDAKAIRERFPDGAVGAEVHVSGQRWGVLCPFSARVLRRAALGRTPEDLRDGGAEGFDEHQRAIQEAVFDGATVSAMPEGEGLRPWQFLLAWLARDQECRLADLLAWRHVATSSLSPVRHTSSADRLQALRVVLGWHSPEVSDGRTQVVRLARERDLAKARADLDTKRLEVLRDELAAGLSLAPEEVWPPRPSALEGPDQAAERHRSELTRRADERWRRVAALQRDPELEALEGKAARLDGELARKASRAEAVTTDLEVQRNLVKTLVEKQASTRRAAREASYPTCPYDDAAIDVPKAAFVCPLPRLPDPVSARVQADDARREREEAEARLQRLSGEQGEVLQVIAELTAQKAAVDRRLGAALARSGAADADARRAGAMRAMVPTLFECADAADASAGKLEDAENALEAAREAFALALAKEPILHVARWFDRLTQRLLTAQAHGRLTLDGQGLKAHIDMRKPMSSVALDSVKVVLFDLAALLASVEGHGRVPGFLVHDSPREGDLSRHVYDRLFGVVLALAPDAETAPFQYILTTTSNPPEGPARERVRLTLGSGDPELRLLKADL